MVIIGSSELCKVGCFGCIQINNSATSDVSWRCGLMLPQWLTHLASSSCCFWLGAHLWQFVECCMWPFHEVLASPCMTMGKKIEDARSYQNPPH